MKYQAFSALKTTLSCTIAAIYSIYTIADITFVTPVSTTETGGMSFVNDSSIQ